MSTQRRIAPFLGLLLTGAVVSASGGSAQADPLTGVYFRLGGLDLIPLPRSGPVTLSDISGPASLAVQNGPIAGSSAGMNSVAMGGVTVGYHISQLFSVETILGLPPTVTLTAKGTLATKSLAATALGSIPTGVQPLGDQLGQTKVLPPVITGTFKLFPEWRVDPYIGAGFAYLYAYDSKVTNPILTQVGKPELDIPGAAGFVVQTGIDFKIWRGLVFTADFKYIAGLSITATMKNVEVEVPNLPLYGAAHVGNATVSATINPIIVSGGLGWDF